MTRKIDRVGLRVGKLLVLSEYPERAGDNRIQYLCQCECGRKITRSVNLLTRCVPIRSCGCDTGRLISSKKVTHGRSGVNNRSPEYNTWVLMKKRCNSPKDKYYSLYGARGIAVCERWLNSFENFSSDMGERPSDKHSIDRIDNDKGYSPENCRWALPQDQARNRRSNTLLEFNGRTQCLKAWADEIGINSTTLLRRLKRWSKDRAFTQQKGNRGVKSIDTL